MKGARGMRKDTVIRFVLVVGLVVLWLWLRRAHPEWTRAVLTGAWGFTDERVYRGGWVAAVVLALYVAASVWVLMKTRHSGGPDAGMGIGCSWIIIAGLLLAGALLAVGMIFRVKFLVVVIGMGTLFTAVPIVYGLIVEGWKAWRKRRAGR
jgi:hypothetical protein